jgi:hypothetical protein
MSMNDICVKVEELLPAYALGVLGSDDRAFVVAHINSCANCTILLADYSDVGEGLLHIPAPISPAPGVRARLIAEIANSESQAVPSLGFFRRFTFFQWVSGAALALVVVANFFLARQTAQLNSQVDQLLIQQGDGQTALALSTYPDAQTVTISGDEVTGTFVFDPDHNLAVANIWGLDPLPPGEVYQGWLVSADGGRTNAGLLEPKSGEPFSVFVIQSTEPISSFVGFGMTIEPGGGSLGPTGPKVLGAEL